MANCKYCKADCAHRGAQRQNECKGYVPMTNADRTRAMSDEELAKILNAFTAYFDECNRSSFEVDCKDCELCELCLLGENKALDWLKQPVEDDR